MKGEQLDDLLALGPDLPPSLAEKVRAQILRDTRPVKPMMSGLAYALLVTGFLTVVAVLFAALFGFGGWRLLSSTEAAAMFCVLAALALAGGAMVARSMRPGSGNLHSVLLGLVAVAAYEALVLNFFRAYSMTLFVHQGVLCLALGVLCAAVAGLPVWVILKRGFIVEPVRAGAALGLVSGLAGLTALTLHCNVTTAPHAGVWHAAVILVSIASGALVGRYSFRA